MKILILSPHINAEHKIHSQLLACGIAALYPGDAIEAWQTLKLHGRSVDIALIHVEDGRAKEANLDLVSSIKSDPDQQDLPFIISSDTWSDLKCAEHQQTPEGANAYLKSPIQFDPLIQTVEAVLGISLRSGQKKNLKDLGRTAPLDLAEHSVSIEMGGHRSSLSAPSMAVSSEIPPQIQTNNAPKFTEVVEFAEVVEKRKPAKNAEPSWESELPYLFGPKKSLLEMLQPQGDAVVPGGAAKAPDTETLKSYLLLREQDVSALSAQLRAAKTQLVQLEDQLKDEQHKQSDLQQIVNSQKKKISEFEKNKSKEFEALQKEIQEIKFQGKLKADKAKQLEIQILAAQDDMEKIRERVRIDIRRIRTREKELENQLEIVKKDSEVLVSARENRIIELKRKLDLLEFNLDLIQERYQREKNQNNKLQEKLDRASQTLKLAEGMLEVDSQDQGQSSEVFLSNALSGQDGKKIAS